MAAFFIKKSNGSFYLRLTDNTNNVKFAAVSEASNTYNFIVNGVTVVSKPFNDNQSLYYTSSASPVPAGGILDNSRFPGTETTYVYSGSGIRDYLLSFNSSPSTGEFYLGGSSLSWDQNINAYPGSGYITNPVAVGVKQSSTWKNPTNIFVKTGGQWREVQTAWIKQNGSWKKYYQNYGNSSWINMLEQQDDAIDFSIKVIAL